LSETDNEYADLDALPPLVRRAALLAERFDFHNSCAIAYVPLLQALASQCRGGTIGEMGTGIGIGTAWIALAVSPDTQIVTIEIDEGRAAAARELFENRNNVTVLQGDALELAEHGPFDLLYCDAGPGKIDHQDEAVAMMKPGGMIVLDDLTPGRDDLGWWLESPDVAAATIWITPELGAILAVRR
jgi:predicted O-methyltransferase YrrM